MATIKTSASHLLRIDSVALKPLGGTIGLTFCPGKKHLGAHEGQWDRDLDADLAVIRQSGAEAVVTLMEGAELVSVHVPPAELSSKVAGLGLEWHLLPISDTGIPNSGFEDLWTYSGLRLRDRLRQGGKIVIHCLGGLGRTGTVAARLLIELGESPENAIRSVRAARPGSIENTTQENYVLHCRPVVAEERHERALVCLLGGALGDAFGYTVEFSSLADIRRRFGPQGISDAVLVDGKFLVSDDTQMTLFTLEGLLHTLEGSSTPTLESIRLAYMEWLKTQRGNQRSKAAPRSGWLIRQGVMHAARAPGNTCLSALGTGGHGTIGKPINNSKGCGGVMRVAPIGLVKQFAPQEAFRLAAEVAALTHGHASGYLSAGMMAGILRCVMDVKDIHGAIESSLAILATYPGHQETTTAVRNALAAVRAKSGNHPAAIQALGAGWVGEEALAIAIYSALSADTFLDAVRIASNHSGDSDSTASIAGQLWGAARGLNGVPNQWVSALDVRIPVLHLAHRLMPFV
jgi:ADP-ribosyl-[dinitrogen reductase] hydrolase